MKKCCIRHRINWRMRINPWHWSGFRGGGGWELFLSGRSRMYWDLRKCKVHIRGAYKRSLKTHNRYFLVNIIKAFILQTSGLLNLPGDSYSQWGPWKLITLQFRYFLIDITKSFYSANIRQFPLLGNTCCSRIHDWRLTVIQITGFVLTADRSHASM